MRLDLSADPWGAAMLGAAAVAVLGLLVVLLALAMRTSKRAGAWILALGLLGFFGASLFGTMQRIRDTDRAAAERPVQGEPVQIIAPDPPPDPDEVETGTPGEPGGTLVDPATPTATAGDTGTAVDPTGDASHGDATGSAPDTPPPDDPAPPAGTPASPAPSAGVVALAPAPALPEDPAARRDAVLERLREAKAVALDDERCGDPEALGGAWVSIAAIPHDIVPDRVAVIVRRLERCRRKIVAARTWLLARRRAMARKAFSKSLRVRLLPEHPGLWVGTSGRDNEVLRVAAKTLDATAADALLEAGLRKELASMGFSSAYFSDGGKRGHTVKLDATTTESVLEQELGPFGLVEAFGS